MTGRAMRREKTDKGNEREASYELLRIIAMCMIIALHYLTKGKVLTPLADTGNMNGARTAAWIVEALCLPAVNVYVLISGFFGKNVSFRISKVVRLWLTALFYSLLITGILGTAGMLTTEGGAVPVSAMTIYDWMNVIFPVVTEEYWFITAYLILYLFMPFLNAGMDRLDQKEFRNILIVLFVVFSLAKSILPMQLPIDKKGYDVLWMVCMYLLGGYFGRYGCRLFEKRYRSVLLYLSASLATAAIAFAARSLYINRGLLPDLTLNNYFYTYNHIFCVLASVGLFGSFQGVHITGKRLSAFICRVSACTMGVYLIHEQLYMRYLWPEWFHTQRQNGKWSFLPHMVMTVICVYVLGTLIDILLRGAMHCLRKLWLRIVIN